MPAHRITAQVFSAIYIGDNSSSSPLTRITELATNGVEITEDLPTAYVVSEDADVQSGNHIVTAKLEFYADSGLVTKISRGVSISGSINDPIGTKLYSLLLLSPTATAENSYYLPKVRVDKLRKLIYSKKQAVSQLISLIAENRDPTVPLLYQGTHSYLDGVMGSKSPI